jgi:hypothetical protein
MIELWKNLVIIFISHYYFWLKILIQCGFKSKNFEHNSDLGQATQ